MKKQIILFVLLAGLLTVSCSIEPVISGPDAMDYVTINASLDDGTLSKTTLYDFQVRWDQSDKIALWYGTLNTAMQRADYFVDTIDAEDPRLATFNGLGTTSDDYLGVYPMSASLDCSKKGKLTIALPTNQTGKAGSFGIEANVAVAYSSTTNLSFQNVGGLLAFKVSNSGGHKITAVRLAGTAALSGEAEIKLANLPALDKVTDGVNYLKMSFTNEHTGDFIGSAESFVEDNGSWAGDAQSPLDPSGNEINDGLYYFVALPGSHSAFTLTLIDDAGNTAVASSNYAFAIERNSNTLIADLTVPAEKWHADATVYINEVSETQIELYNPGVSAVDLSGWVLRSGYGSWALLPGTTIAAGSFLTVTTGQATCATGPMFTIGSSVSLVNGGTVDSVDLEVFGAGESYGRTTDGGGEWAVYSTPSLGETNANGTVKTTDTDIIVLNEIDGNAKKIELYNAGESTVTLTGWTLYKDESLVWTGTTETIAAGGYLVLTSAKASGVEQFKGGISPKKNVQVALFNASGVQKDCFTRGEKGSGWGDITLSSNAEASFSRVPNGSGDWKYAAPTPGAENGEKTGTIEQYPAANGMVILNEVNGNTKFIELYSTATDQKISLEDMTIKKDGNLVWTGAPGYVIEPGGYVLLYSTDVTKPGKAQEGYDAGLQFDSGLSPKKAVRVQLYDNSGASLNGFNYDSYSGTPAPASYGRNADGVWYLQAATPGAANTDGDTPVTGLISYSSVAFGNTVRELSGLCLSSDGSILWGVGDEGNLYRFTTIDGNVSAIQAETALTYSADMEGITVDPSTGDLYIAVEPASVYKAVSLYSGVVALFDVAEASGMGGDGIEGIAWHNGELYIGAQSGATLWCYGLDGAKLWKKELGTIATAIEEVGDLFYDSAGDLLWVADSKAKKLFVFDGDVTELVATYDISFIGNAESVCVDRTRHCVWLADDNSPSRIFRCTFPGI